jgi:TonB-linked SusC/RagA family outer membrane protein
MKTFSLLRKKCFNGRHVLRQYLLLPVFFFLLFPSLLIGEEQQEKITLNLKNVNIVEFFKEVEKQTPFKFFYRNSQVEAMPKVSIEVKDQPITSVLNTVFSKTNLTYIFNDKQIVIQQRAAGQPGSQTIKITGIVVDKNQVPLAGVSVMMQSTKKGTFTDENGKFSLDVQMTKGATLIVSMIGMINQVIYLDGKTEYKVVMEDDQQQLSEVVITGYQTLPKERSTGAATTLSSEVLEKTTNFSLKDKLEGLVPGLYFEPNYVEDQYPTEDASRSIIIRGASTFGDNNPLIVIDGFPVSSASDPWKTINPDDIENVTVLKDASAASIWGAQAANGVIVITTKRGKSVTPRIDVSVDFYAQPAPNLYKIPWASSSDAVDLYKWMAFETTYLDQLGTNADIYNKYDLPPVMKTLAEAKLGLITMDQANAQLDQLRNIDVRKEFADLFLNKMETNTKANIAFQVGSASHSFRTSLTATSNQKYNKGNTKTDYIISVNDQYAPAKWIRVSLNANINLTEQTDNGVSINELNYINQMTRILDDNGDYLPMAAQYSKANNYDRYYSLSTASRRDTVAKYRLPYDWDYNLKREYDNSDNTQKNSDLRLTAKVNLMPFDGLSVELSYQYQYINRYTREYYNESTWLVRNQVNNNAQQDGTYPIPPGGMLYENKRFGAGNNYRAQVSYDKQIKGHSIKLMAGTEWRKDYYDENPYGYYGYDPQALTYASGLDFKTSYTKLSGQTNYYTTVPMIPGKYYFSIGGRDDRYVGYFGNFGYSYGKKYDLTGSIRLDKTNLFGGSEEVPDLPQWSLGAGWTITAEKFAKQYLKGVSYLKLRASYGWQGNIDKSAAPYLYGYPWTDKVTLLPYSAIQSAPNPNLTWEKTQTYNIGLDYGFLNHNLTGTINFYRKNSKDCLVQLAVNGTYGFQNNRASLNAGRLENTGLEFDMQANIINHKNFKWQTMFQYSTNKNIARGITKVSDNISAYTSMAFYYRKPDRPLSYLAAIEWAGYDEVGLPKFIYDGQETKVTDVANVSTLEMDKLFKFVGQKDPKHFGSWTNRLVYKNFELSLSLYYKFGHKVIGDYPATGMFSSFMSATKYFTFLPEKMLYRWKSEADANTAQMYCLDNKITNSSHTQLIEAIMAYGTQNVYNAGSIRVKSLTLSYSIPKSLLNKINLKDLRIVLEGRNLGPIVKFAPFDPDNPPYSSSTYGALMFVTRNRPEFSAGLKIGLF